MRRGVAVLVVVVGGVVPVRVGAQATGMPSYNAPYRAFQRSELGAVFSFPNGGGTGFEGAYRYASGTLDVGLRGGIFDPPGSGKAVLLAGVEARQRVITHTIDFPLDGAIVFGAGAGLVSGGSTLFDRQHRALCPTHRTVRRWQRPHLGPGVRLRRGRRLPAVQSAGRARLGRARRSPAHRRVDRRRVCALDRHTIDLPGRGSYPCCDTRE